MTRARYYERKPKPQPPLPPGDRALVALHEADVL